MNEEVYVGIDLGTTFCSVAVYRPSTQETEVLEIEGSKTIPSQVYYGTPTYFGQKAKDQLQITPTLVAYDSKRMIGRTYDEVKAQNMTWPFRIEGTSDNEVDIILENKGKTQVVSPVQVSAEILKYLKTHAEKIIGKFDGAVITIPQAFSDAQRKATKNAAIIAGFDPNKIHFLPEPTSAAIKFAHKASADHRHHILIYDFGGGTFDISRATINNRKIKINSTGGDSKLGGQDIDAAIVDYLAPEIEKQVGIKIKEKGQERMYNLVKAEAEEVKKKFSTSIKTVSITIKFDDNKIFEYKIREAKFKSIIEPIIDRTIALTNEQAEQTSDEQQIILVGGSSMIPLITERIEELGLSVIADISRLTAVAEGAAYYHYINKNHKKKVVKKPPNSNRLPIVTPLNFSQPLITPREIEEIEERKPVERVISQPILADDMEIIEILSSSIGIADGNDNIIKILKKGEKLPCSGTQKFKNFCNGDAIGINIYEGEDSKAEKCKKICYADFDIPPNSPKGSITFEFTISVDNNNLIECHYKRTDESGDSEYFLIDKDRSADRYAVEIAKRKIREKEERERIIFDFEKLVETVLNTTQKLKKKFQTNKKSAEWKAAEELDIWIEDHETDRNTDPAEYKGLFDELQDLFDEFMTKYKNHLQ